MFGLKVTVHLWKPGQELRAERTWGQEQKQKQWEHGAYWIAILDFFSYLSYTTQGWLSPDADVPTSVKNQENGPQPIAAHQSDGGSSSAEMLSSQMSQDRYQYDKKQTNKKKTMTGQSFPCQ